MAYIMFVSLWWWWHKISTWLIFELQRKFGKDIVVWKTIPRWRNIATVYCASSFTLHIECSSLLQTRNTLVLKDAKISLTIKWVSHDSSQKCGSQILFYFKFYWMTFCWTVSMVRQWSFSSSKKGKPLKQRTVNQHIRKTFYFHGGSFSNTLLLNPYWDY